MGSFCLNGNFFDNVTDRWPCFNCNRQLKSVEKFLDKVNTGSYSVTYVYVLLTSNYTLLGFKNFIFSTCIWKKWLL